MKTHKNPCLLVAVTHKVIAHQRVDEDYCSESLQLKSCESMFCLPCPSYRAAVLRLTLHVLKIMCFGPLVAI